MRPLMRLVPFGTLSLLLMVAGLAVLPATGHGQAGARGKKYALLVGVQEYDHAKQFRNLSYAENDVRETAKELKKAGYTVVLLSTKDEKNKPTLANIEKHLDALLSQATKHDLILVGLAGHGVQFDKKEDSYFCPVDARIDNVKTLLSMRTVYKKLEDSPVGVGLLLVDACRDDGGPRSARKRGVDGDRLPSPPRGVAALFSCSSGQFAWETPKYKHGVFFHFVLEGLRGKARDEDGEVSWASLSAYVSKRVSKTVPNLIGGGAQQEPHEMKSLAGVSPILLETVTIRDVVSTKPGKTEVVKTPVKAEITWTRKIKNSIGMELVRISKGKFRMGSPSSEVEHKDEENQREEIIPRDFWMGTYEVTQAQYKEVMGDNPSAFTKARVKALKDTYDFPVENVTWIMARKFCEALSERPAEKKAGRVYRLPTEAEWEYACRAGTTTPFSFGGEVTAAKANFNGDLPYPNKASLRSKKYPNCPCKVGSYPANAWGLYDMHGNVYEWCADARDGGSGTSKVIRGGSWYENGAELRSANRQALVSSTRDNQTGFRVVCEPRSP